jgi:hypothetical protein
MFGFYPNNNEDNVLLSVRGYLKKIISYEPATKLYTDANPYAIWSPDNEPQTQAEKAAETQRCMNYITNHMKHWKNQIAAQHFFKERYERMKYDHQRKEFDWDSWAENFVPTSGGPFKSINPEEFKPDIWEEQPSILLVGRLKAMSRSAFG